MNEATASMQREGPAQWATARTGAAAMAAVVGLWCLPLFVMLVAIPKFEEIFRDFGVPLPGLAVWLINSSRWLMGDQVGQSVPGIVIAAPIFLVLLGAAMVLVMRERSWLVLLGLLLLPILFIAMTVYAMYVPLVAMIESLQGGGAV